MYTYIINIFRSFSEIDVDNTLFRYNIIGILTPKHNIMYNTCSRGRRYYFGGVCYSLLSPASFCRQKKTEKKTNFNPMFTGLIFIALNNRPWRPRETGTAVIVISSIREYLPNTYIILFMVVILRLVGRYYIYLPFYLYNNMMMISATII